MNGPPADCRVTFLPANRQVLVAAGTTIIRAAREAGLHINASCGGTGVCGKCRVRIEEGAVAGGLGERLSPAEQARGIRQACTAEVHGDVVIRIEEAGGLRGGQLDAGVPERHRARMHVFDLGELQEEGIFIPPVEKFFLELPRPDYGDRQADAGRLLRALAEQYGERHIVISYTMLRRLRRVLREDDFRVTVTLERPVNKRFRSRLLHIQSGNWTARNYGIAVDIGTTTVYAQLLDKQSGKVLAERGDYNRQLGYGEDVISRMIVAEKPEGLKQMHDLVTESINGLIDAMLKEKHIGRDEITSITLAGNTTMTHLFLELEPHNIRRSPYVPVSTMFPPVRAAELGLHLGDHCMASALSRGIQLCGRRYRGRGHGLGHVPHRQADPVHRHRHQRGDRHRQPGVAGLRRLLRRPGLRGGRHPARHAGRGGGHRRLQPRPESPLSR